MSPTGTTETGELTLSEGERDVLAADASAFARALRDSAARERYGRLAEAAESGHVPEELLAPLETMLELLFDKGRPSNRAILQSVYARTPRGRRQSAEAREVNRALQTLRGHAVSEVRVTAGVTSHTVVVETDRCRITLQLDREGARVTALEAG